MRNVYLNDLLLPIHLAPKFNLKGKTMQCIVTFSGKNYISSKVFVMLLFFQARPPYQVGKKRGNGCARGWCVRRGSLLQDHLPVKFQDVKFKDLKLKHEIFMRIDMIHSYFSTIS